MRTTVRIAAVLPVLGLAASCGAGGGGGSPVPLGDYCDEYASITCEAAERCGCLEGLSIDLCIMYQHGECVDEVETPVGEGRYAYDAGAAGRCLSAIRAMLRDCTGESLYWPEACDDMLQGLVPEGGGCGEDGECVGDMECWNDACTRMPRDGQPCLEGYACADDAFCGDDEICHAYRGRGQPCPEGDYACDDDLYCDPRTTTCQPYLGQGESCAHDEYACDDDLYCSPSSLTCRPYPTSGQDCTDSGGECADDLWCDEGGVCRPQRRGGEACTEDEQCLSWDCVDGFCEDDGCAFL